MSAAVGTSTRKRSLRLNRRSAVGISLFPVDGPRRMNTAPDDCDAAGKVTGLETVSVPVGA
jgi:hypothetical protein